MTIEQKLQSIIDRFVGEITDLVREAALESVQSALAGTEGQKAPAQRKTAARKTASRKAASGKRVRRSTADLRATADAILAYIKSNDGCAMSDLTGKFGQPAVKLRPAVQILLGEGSAHTTGAKRGTKYHAGKGGAKRKSSATKGPAKRKASATKARRKPATRKTAKKKTKRR